MAYLVRSWSDKGIVSEITTDICRYDFAVDAFARNEVLVVSVHGGGRSRCHQTLLWKGSLWTGHEQRTWTDDLKANKVQAETIMLESSARERERRRGTIDPKMAGNNGR